ncbi:MAG: hypothetical protein NC311_06460 [Muribaculaceae bacterium]|nr:hypothetical protein [Muribaculaceae bacterium]
MIRMETATTVAESGVMIDKITFPPNGTSHDLQRKVTDLMHQIVTEYGQFTLAELGYLHINTLTYDKEKGQLYFKVYFDVHHAARVQQSDVNASRKLVPVAELNVFQGYLFIGNLLDAITYERILAPKAKSVEDELGRAALKFKEDSSKIVETDALVLNCSLPVVMAAALGISLTDPEFKVSCETVGKGGKNAVKSIVATSNSSEVPVSVTVTHTHGDTTPYDPDDAEPYLIGLMDRLQKASQNQTKLKQSVRKKAKKNGEKNSRQKNKGFNKYS